MATWDRRFYIFKKTWTFRGSPSKQFIQPLH